MASDGVWDNLYPEDVSYCLSKQLPSVKKGWFEDKQHNENYPIHMIRDPQQAADCIALEAEQLGKRNYYWSPFATEAAKYYNNFQPRGKEDDVTVVVAQLHPKSSQKDKTTNIFNEQEVQGSGFSLPYYEKMAESKKLL